MGKIPTVERRVSPSGGDPFRTQRPDTSVGQAMERFGGAVMQAGEVVGDIVEKAQKIERTRTENDARLEAQKQINEIVVENNETKDSKQWPEQYERVGSSINNILGGIEDPVAAENLRHELLGYADKTVTSMKIKAIGRNLDSSRNAVNVSRANYINIGANIQDITVIGPVKTSFINSLVSQAKLEGFDRQWILEEINKADKEMNQRKIRNLTVDNPDAAQERLELTDHLYDKTEKSSMQKLIDESRVSNKLKLEKQVAISESASISDLQKQFDDGTLNLAAIDVAEDENPILSDPTNKIADKYRNLVVSRNTIEKKIDDSVYMELLDEFYDITKTKKTTKTGKVQIKIDSLGPKQLKKLIGLQSRFVDEQIKGTMGIDESASMNKLFSNALEDNPRFVRNLGYLGEASDKVTSWATKAYNNAKRRNPELEIDSSGFAAEVMKDVLNNINGDEPKEEIEQFVSAALYKTDRALAHITYDISAIGDDEWVIVGDNYYKVTTYSNGEPKFETEKIDADNTK